MRTIDLPTGGGTPGGIAAAVAALKQRALHDVWEVRRQLLGIYAIVALTFVAWPVIRLAWHLCAGA